jgi:hypothetical protein
MHYFDNTPLIEKIVETSTAQPTKIKNGTGWWIAGLILTGCIAGFFYYKHRQLKKELGKQK